VTDEPPPEPQPPVERQEPFLFRLVRTAIAPPVLKDGGRDAPMSRRGRIVFTAVVSVLVVAIVVLLVAVSAQR
jgi:hypothetical protein